MRYKLLGSSGLRVSELCLGTMSFGEVWGFGADEKESHRILDRFAAAGGNFVDTANKYHEGRSEEILGTYLGSERDRWVIASKYTLAMTDDDPNAAGNSRKSLRNAVEGSLRRLGTDHLDLLWVHAWDFTMPVEDVMRALDDVVRSGKVLALGLSDTPAWIASQANTFAALRGWNPFVALQFPHSLIERTVERELIPAADALDLTVTAWAPLGTGFLTGKYTRGEPGDSKRAAGNSHLLTESNLTIAREVDRIADEIGATSAQVALAWVRRFNDRTIPVVGIRTVEQLDDALGTIDVSLSPEQFHRLDEVSRIDLGFPASLLASPNGQMLYGDLEPRIELPAEAPYRRYQGVSV